MLLWYLIHLRVDGTLDCLCLPWLFPHLRLKRLRPIEVLLLNVCIVGEAFAHALYGRAAVDYVEGFSLDGTSVLKLLMVLDQYLLLKDLIWYVSLLIHFSGFIHSTVECAVILRYCCPWSTPRSRVARKLSLRPDSLV